MAQESLHVFDPRRNMHVQGFSGRAATTTLHDATATGVSVSGIFQAKLEILANTVIRGTYGEGVTVMLPTLGVEG